MQNNIQDWYNFLLNGTVCAKAVEKDPQKTLFFCDNTAMMYYSLKGLPDIQV